MKKKQIQMPPNLYKILTKKKKKTLERNEEGHERKKKGGKREGLERREI